MNNLVRKVDQHYISWSDIDTVKRCLDYHLYSDILWANSATAVTQPDNWEQVLSAVTNNLITP